jgi:putative endonuclease
MPFKQNKSSGMKRIPGFPAAIQGNSYRAGLFTEFMARAYLRMHGFKILKSRYVTGRHTGRAEIDIIAKRGNLILFCEVKKRASLSAAFDAITLQQAACLRRAAESYLSKTGWAGSARFDAIAFCAGKLHWIKNII